MTDERIGQYVVRARDNGHRTLPHFVESVIADEPITRCGRRFRLIEGSTLEYGAVAIEPCKRCG